MYNDERNLVSRLVSNPTERMKYGVQHYMSCIKTPRAMILSKSSDSNGNGLAVRVRDGNVHLLHISLLGSGSSITVELGSELVIVILVCTMLGLRDLPKQWEHRSRSLESQCPSGAGQRPCWQLQGT